MYKASKVTTTRYIDINHFSFFFFFSSVARYKSLLPNAHQRHHVDQNQRPYQSNYPHHHRGE